MAGELRGWLAVGALGLLAAGWPVACKGSRPVDSGGSEVEAQVLAAVGPEVVLPALDALLVEITALKAATAAWSAAPEDEAAREAARQAWRATLLRWQVLEVMQLGPAASSLTAAGGEDLRDLIYSWPTTNPCRVDQEVVAAEWDDPDFVTTRLVTSYGLDALEHVLWGEADNACPSQVDINAEGSWDALGAEGVRANRAAFAEALAGQVEAHALALGEAWDPSGGDFSGALAAAGDGEPYPSVRLGLNAIFDALFYLETQTKDAKLAVPAGVLGCEAETCPDEVELPASGASLEAVAANLRGFRLLFTGGEGAGFDDLLADLGHGDLSDAILGHVDAAEAMALAIEGPLEDALARDHAAVLALHAEVKAACDLLKVDLVTVLSVQVPSEAAGDTD